MPPRVVTDSTAQAWRREAGAASLHGTVTIPAGAGFLRKLIAFGGPGYLISVGYMDPGNWATDLGGGSAYGYTLLSAVLLSSLMAMVLQALSLRLGIATGRDLAQACRDTYSRPASIALWILAEIGIVACDLAEVVGTAIALELLFGLPLLAGVVLTVLDTLIVLSLQRFGFRVIESIVIALVALIALSFAYELAVARPDLAALLHGILPQRAILTDPGMLFIAVGIVGATVMPHNLYLHSALMQTRRFDPTIEGRREAIRFATIDSCMALMLALLVNGAILVLAAAAFHRIGRTDIAEIQDAYHLLAPALGVPLAALVFALALLLSGQNSTLTGTLAGQIVMEGFLDLRIKPWLRRLITRAAAVVPAALVIAIAGESSATRLLIVSQVVLSLQLPFAMIPLVYFTGDRRKMGVFASPLWLKAAAWAIAVLITGLNIKLLIDLV
ncbi:MAG TPA: Nramp family divalent metal transporter [Aliidongia sp.]|nr:Nramp family divalent metal transporter [Aliidongia sp.]